MAVDQIEIVCDATGGTARCTREALDKVWRHRGWSEVGAGVSGADTSDSGDGDASTTDTNDATTPSAASSRSSRRRTTETQE